MSSAHAPLKKRSILETTFLSIFAGKKKSRLQKYNGAGGGGPRSASADSLFSAERHKGNEFHSLKFALKEFLLLYWSDRRFATRTQRDGTQGPRKPASSPYIYSMEDRNIEFRS